MIYTVSVVPDGPVREIDVAFSYECWSEFCEGGRT